MNIEQHILRKKHLYFGNRAPSVEAISDHIVLTAQTLGATEVSVNQKNGWTVIESDLDWLYAGEFPRKGEGRIWDRPWPFPEASPNTPRFEVMVRVFSERAFSTDGVDIEVIRGKPPSEQEVLQLGLGSRTGNRCIAFIFSEHRN